VDEYKFRRAPCRHCEGISVRALPEETISGFSYYCYAGTTPEEGSQALLPKIHYHSVLSLALSKQMAEVQTSFQN
jgi:hypothetical protein